MSNLLSRLARLEAERLKALRLRMVGMRTELESIYSVGLLEAFNSEVVLVMAELPPAARKAAYSKLEGIAGNATNS